jgi:hypothetical protein
LWLLLWLLLLLNWRSRRRSCLLRIRQCCRIHRNGVQLRLEHSQHGLEVSDTRRDLTHLVLAVVREVVQKRRRVDHKVVDGEDSFLHRHGFDLACVEKGEKRRKNETCEIVELSILSHVNLYLGWVNSCHFFRSFRFNIDGMIDFKDLLVN